MKMKYFGLCSWLPDCFGLLCLLWSVVTVPVYAQTDSVRVILGDERTEVYYPLLQDKRIALFANHTAVVSGRHLLDRLLEQHFQVSVVFSPEHGFRGTADAGQHISGSVDVATGIPIYSLYNGKQGKPSVEWMRKFDVLVVDIQDVGLRFYTYYITMCRLMDVCAQYGKQVILLDRPNPNGHYVDGPVLDMRFRSGVGWLPIPVVHGMTLGELAQMINGEGWLPQHRICKLTVIPCLNYTHSTPYRLPVPPSPNLPNMRAVYLYPSLCLFEGTPVSVGRGTAYPFQLYGHPSLHGYPYSFVPRSMPGAMRPPLQGKRCYGINLTTQSEADLFRHGFDLSYVIDVYRHGTWQGTFFRPFFDLLMGTDKVRKSIQAGRDAASIRADWQPELEQFKLRRRPYLIYAE